MASTNGITHVDGLYESVQKWTLAQDTSLFEHLEGLTGRMVSRMEAMEKRFQGVTDGCQKSHVRLQTCLNSFNMLSNTQFMESRVRDEDSQLHTQAKLAEQPENVAVETPENKRWKELQEIIALTKGVLQSSFDVVEINVEDSDEEDGPSNRRTFREPKDPYLHRPLPFLIGSEAFHRDRFVGLKLQHEEEKIIPDEDVILTTKSDDILVPNQSTPLGGSTRSLAQSSSSRDTDNPQSLEDLRNVDGSAAFQKGKTFSGRGATVMSSDSDDENDIFSTRPVAGSKPDTAPTVGQIFPVDGRTSTPTPHTRSSSQSSIQSSNPSKPVTSLFDAEDDEEDGLFSTVKPKSKAPGKPAAPAVLQPPTAKPVVKARSTASPRTSRTTSLFDDEDDANDMFQVSKSVAKQKPMANPLLSELSKKIGVTVPSGSSTVEPPTSQVSPVADTREPVIAPRASLDLKKPARRATLFEDDDDDDDLFSFPSANAITKSLSAKNQSSNITKASLETSGGSAALPTRPTAALNPKKPFVLAEPEEDDKTYQPDLTRSSAQKYPVAEKMAGFGGYASASSVFKSDDESDDLFHNAKVPGVAARTTRLVSPLMPSPLSPSTPSPSSPKQVTVPKEEPPPFFPLPRSKVTSSNIFDDDSDGEDLFAAPRKRTDKAPSKPTVIDTPSTENVAVKHSQNIVEETKPRNDESNLYGKGGKWKLPGLVAKVVEAPFVALTEDSSTVKNEGIQGQATDGEAATRSPDVIRKLDRQMGSESSSPHENSEDRATSFDSPLAFEAAAPSPIVTSFPSSTSVDQHDIGDKSIGEGDTVDGDFPEPQLLPPPKTAPAAFYRPMNWKIPEVVANGEESPVAIAPSPTQHALKLPALVDHKPMAKPPAPVPRRRSPKTTAAENPRLVNLEPAQTVVQPGSDSSKFNDKSTQPDFHAIFEESEEKILSESNGKFSPVPPQIGDTIPLIPEMTLDETPPAKPPVAARRTPKNTEQVQQTPSTVPSTEEGVLSSIALFEMPHTAAALLEGVGSPSLSPIIPSPVLGINRTENLSHDPLTTPIFSAPDLPNSDEFSEPLHLRIQESPTKLQPVPVFNIPAPLAAEKYSSEEPPPLSALSSSLSSSASSLKKRGGSLFLDDDDSDEDLFSQPKLPPSGKSSRKSSLMKVENGTDFPFNTVESPLTWNVNPVAAPSGKQRKGIFEQGLNKRPALFESDDEDLFASSANATRAVAQTLANARNDSVAVKRKDERAGLFEDEDDDGLFKK